MANRIVIKKGTTAGTAPQAADLLPGELAINSADGGFYTKLENGTVYTITPANTAALAISRGGTGLTTTPSAGQILYGQAGGTYALRTLTAGSNITITEAGGAVTIALTPVVTSDTLTTSATTANQVVAQLATATHRSVKYVIQATSGTAYQVTEILMIHDGTTVYLTEYATILTGASLASFNADVSGGNMRLLVTPVNAVTTIRAVGNPVAV